LHVFRQAGPAQCVDCCRYIFCSFWNGRFYCRLIYWCATLRHWERDWCTRIKSSRIPGSWNARFQWYVGKI